MVFPVSNVGVTRNVLRVSPIERTLREQNAYQQLEDSWLRSAETYPYQAKVINAANGIAGFLQSAQEVRSKAAGFPAVMRAREAIVSDSSSALAVAGDGASIQRYRLSILAVATSQRNVGFEMNKEDATEVKSGTNRFKLKIGGKTTRIQSRIGETDSNEQALTSIKNTINSAKLGVTASLSNHAEIGTIALDLVSDKSGASNKFTLEDEEGNVVKSTGIGRVKRLSADASYSVNGGPALTSGSNSIELEKGKVTATLLKPTASGGAIDLIVRPDAVKMTEYARQLVSGYNEMRDRLTVAGGAVHPATVKKSLDQAANIGGLDEIGIHADGMVRLSVDERQLTSSLRSSFEQTSRTLAGSQGLAGSIERVTTRIGEVPAIAYLNPQFQAMQPFSTYSASMKPLLKIPVSGVLVDGTG